MSAAKKLQPQFEVVILANDHERFARYAEFLEKKGFSCRVVQSADEISPGSLAFVSLECESAVKLARQMDCILFSESEHSTDTNLSSTLPHPYSEKTFLKAAQASVKRQEAFRESFAFKKSKRRSRRRFKLQSETAEIAASENKSTQRMTAHPWGILVLALVGCAACLYFIYEMIFTGRY